MIEKRSNPLDARSVVLELTVKGRNALAQLDPLRHETEQLMYGSLNREQVEVLHNLLSCWVADAHAALMQFERSIKKDDDPLRFGVRRDSKLRMRSARIG
jgi:DNA-binding MarR family transcriptional regulator